MSEWVFDDGGRTQAGFKGFADDCVVRAICIASGSDYRWVYDEMSGRMKDMGRVGRKGSARNGVTKKVYKPFIEDELGFLWTPTMRIGQGTTVHLLKAELPEGRLIVRASRHLVAVIDGVIHDTHDPSREGTRCVYGYWTYPWP